MNSQRHRKTPPKVSDFPDLKWIYESSHDGIDENLLILFHGLGDNPANFINFGIKMQLPQTAVLAIRGPVPIPGFAMEEGSGWQATFDEMGEELAPSHPLVRATVQSTRHVVARFVQFLGTQWPLANIFLLGFSQGGSTAIDVALFGSLPVPVGGVVSISGWVDSSLCEASPLGAMANTQVLVTQGERDEELGEAWKAKRAFLASLLCNSLTVQPIQDKGHSMPSSALEMRYIMEFFGKNLKLRNVALESMSDVYEVKLSQ